MVMITSMRSEAEARGNNPLMYHAFQDEAKEEKWHKYYSSFQRILLVGEGDFSFSLCLAKSFGSASNIVATCIDSEAALNQKYTDARKNVKSLEKLGATVLYGVDATKMKIYHYLRMMKFDRIVYNFPHAGFRGQEDDVRLIRKHRSLVYGFFANARSMLYPNGEVHVNHKTTAPFSYWNLEELASWNFLGLLFYIDFKIEDYPGYRNKRGDGSRCDESFPLGKCCTFMFVVEPTAMKMYKESNFYPAPGRLQTFQNIHFPRNSIGIACPPPPCNPLGIARPPPTNFHVRPPPLHSFGIVPFERESVPFIRVPPPHSFGIVPFERESVPFIREPPPYSFGIEHFEREAVPIIRQPPPHSFGNVSNMHEYTTAPRHIDMRSERPTLFDGYLNHGEEEYGKSEFELYYLVKDALTRPLFM